MDNKYITCHECGRAINSKKGIFYNPRLDAYTCPVCYPALCKEASKKVGGFKVYWKLILGIILLALGSVFFWTDSDLLLLLSLPLQNVGILFIILHAVTMGRIKRNAVVEYQTNRHNQARSKNTLIELWKCPHCGASTKGDFCEYCDSIRETEN